MKTTRILLLLAIFATATLTAQFNDRPPRTDTYTVGLNGGKAWLDSDVATDGGFGAGLTIGKSFGRNSNFPLGLDLRTRLLYTQTRGMNAYSSDVAAGNDALNGSRGVDGPDYSDFPFVFDNYQTHTFEAGVEAGLTLNQLRRNRGIIAGVYGGIGAVWNRATIDQLDAQGNEYFGPYARVDQGLPNDVTLRELRGNVFDGTYETLGDSYGTDFGKINIAPSVGVELGLELTPNIALVGGHRVTFTGQDHLDGQQWRRPDQDVLHYTNIGLQFTFNRQRNTGRQRTTRPRWNPLPPRRPRTGGGGTTGPVYTPDYRSEPVVEWTTPRARTETTATTYRVEARVRYADELVFEVNGRRSYDFTLEQDCFVANVPLDLGRNFLELRARNRYGTEVDRVDVYREAVVEYGNEDTPVLAHRPAIRITRPNANEWTTEARTYTLEATLDHVARPEQIELFHNDVRRDFDFTNGKLRSEVALNVGDNQLRIVAANSAGASRKGVLIIRREQADKPGKPTTPVDNPVLEQEEWDDELDLEEAEVALPRVDIQKPFLDRVTTTQPTMVILADVHHVQETSGIKLRVNGKTFAIQQFNPKTGRLKHTVALKRGSNVVEITATNAASTARDQVVILYEPKPVEKPTNPVDGDIDDGGEKPTRPVVTEPVPNKPGKPTTTKPRKPVNPTPTPRPGADKPTKPTSTVTTKPGKPADTKKPSGTVTTNPVGADKATTPTKPSGDLAEDKKTRKGN